MIPYKFYCNVKSCRTYTSNMALYCEIVIISYVLNYDVTLYCNYTIHVYCNMDVL